MATSKPLSTVPVSILLADVSKSYREITHKMLKFYDANFLIDDCGSIQECLVKVGRRSFDIILANAKLADGDGIALLEALKKNAIHIPVLLLYDEGQESQALRAYESGAIDYMIKSRGYLTALPFTVKRILERKDILQNRKVKENLEARQEIFTHKGYFILNHRGRFLSANPGMEAICGYTEDELLELTILDVLPKGREWELFEWLQGLEKEPQRTPFVSEIIGKYGSRLYARIGLSPIRDDADQIKSYRGELEEIKPEIMALESKVSELEHINIADSIWELVNSSYADPMPKLLGRLAQLSCQIFKFQRATVALLDKSRLSYVKVAMIGYSYPAETDKRRLEVPKEVIDRIFLGRHRVKVLYYSQDKRNEIEYLNPLIHDRRSQKRRPPEQWHPRDVVMINLASRDLRSFGYVSLDDPLENFLPNRKFFLDLEIFSRLASFVIENHARIMEKDQRSRRLTQVLLTSNIFKLYLSMPDLLKEIVWSIKFSLDFNLVVLALISQKSGMVEMRSVACDDKIRAQQIEAIRLNMKEFMSLMLDEYKIGKSFLVKRKHPALQPIKQIYYSGPHAPRSEDDWPLEAALIVPLKTRTGRIMGAILIDDPADLVIPDREYIRTLEILANQVSVAIENRLLYVDARRPSEPRPPESIKQNIAMSNGESPDAQIFRRRRFWDKLFKEK